MMKIVVFCVLLATGYCQAEYALEKRSAHLRLVRSIDPGGFMVSLRYNFMTACKSNGMDNVEEDKLDISFDDLETCVSKKAIYSVPEEEYTQNIEDCSKDLLKQLKACLPEGSRFFPDYIIQLRSSMTAFFYRNKDLMKSKDLQTCLRTLEQFTNATISCIRNVANQIHPSNLPKNKEEVCTTMEKIGSCYEKKVAICQNSSDIDTFVRGYTAALNQPCKIQ